MSTQYTYFTEFAIQMMRLEEELTERGIKFEPGEDEFTVILAQPMPEDLIEAYGLES